MHVIYIISLVVYMLLYINIRLYFLYITFDHTLYIMFDLKYICVIYVCICLSMYAYVHTHTHTHTYIYKKLKKM